MDTPASMSDGDDPSGSGDGGALRRAGRRALADAIPLFLPAIPFGFVIGVEIDRSPLGPGLGLASSLLVFAGSAQLALITLLGSAGLGPALATGIVLNARHVMYSAALAPVFRGQPRWFRWLGPATLIDQVFALSIPRSGDPPPVFRRYYLVISAVFLLGWMLATALGLVLGPAIPAAWRLGFAPAVMFTGLVVLGLDRRPAVVAALVGAATCLAALGLPNRSGLLVGALAGVVAGYLADRRRGATDRTAHGPAGSTPVGGGADGATG